MLFSEENFNSNALHLIVNNMAVKTNRKIKEHLLIPSFSDKLLYRQPAIAASKKNKKLARLIIGPDFYSRLKKDFLKGNN